MVKTHGAHENAPVAPGGSIVVSNTPLEQAYSALTGEMPDPRSIVSGLIL